MTTQRGFTLIEVLVALAVVAIALGAGVRASAALIDNAERLADVVAAQWCADNQRYPSAEQGLDALVRKPSAGAVPPNWKPYLDKLPNDPWARPYQYLNPGVRGEIDVFSFGADGQPGGEGKDADVGSWQ